MADLNTAQINNTWSEFGSSGEGGAALDGSNALVCSIGASGSTY